MNDNSQLKTSALLMAAFNGDVDLINLFHENGANMHVATIQGVNALHMAS